MKGLLRHLSRGWSETGCVVKFLRAHEVAARMHVAVGVGKRVFRSHHLRMTALDAHLSDGREANSGRRLTITQEQRASPPLWSWSLTRSLSARPGGPMALAPFAAKQPLSLDFDCLGPSSRQGVCVWRVGCHLTCLSAN
jgi:hypothetical protein